MKWPILALTAFAMCATITVVYACGPGATGGPGGGMPGKGGKPSDPSDGFVLPPPAPDSPVLSPGTPTLKSMIAEYDKQIAALNAKVHECLTAIGTAEARLDALEAEKDQLWSDMEAAKLRGNGTEADSCHARWKAKNREFTEAGNLRDELNKEMRRLTNMIKLLDDVKKKLLKAAGLG